MQAEKCPTCGHGLVEQAAFCARCGERLPDASAYDQVDYAAFISYRHRSPDREVAARLHQAIERYRLPGAVATAYGSRSLGRVFRDQDELPATGSLPTAIREALKRSGALVVVCSPATAQSEWVAQEIELFAAYHGRDRIFAALAEGPSKQSIPPALRERLAVGPDGQQVVVDAEPLAADLRSDGQARFEVEKLRIIAALAGCSFDDLRQRDKSRRLRRAAGIAAAVLAVVALVVCMALSSSRIVGQHRGEALVAESQQLAVESRQQLARGDRYEAIETALAALPESSSDASRPLVPEAQQALEDALLGADRQAFWRPSYSLSTEHGVGAIDDIGMINRADEPPAGAGTFAFCSAQDYFAVSDDAGTVATYELSTGRKLATCAPPAEGAVGAAGAPSIASAAAEDRASEAGSAAESRADETVESSANGGAEGRAGEAADSSGRVYYVRKMLALPSRLVVADATSAGQLVGFDPLTGDVAWSYEGHSFATLAMAEGAGRFGAVEFDSSGSALAAIFDAASGDVVVSHLFEGAGLGQLAQGVKSVQGASSSELFVGTGNVVSRMNLAEGTIATANLAKPELAALWYGDGLLVAGTVDAYDGDELELGYALEAFDVSKGGFDRAWSYEGKLASEMVEHGELTTLVLGWPAMHGVTSDGGVVASAGRNVYVLDRASGSVAYEHGFASSVLDVRVMRGADGSASAGDDSPASVDADSSTSAGLETQRTGTAGSDRLLIMCVDGTVVVENPESPTRNYDGDRYRLQIGSSIRWGTFADAADSLQLVAASTEADDRLLTYGLGISQDWGSAREYDIDELIALAHAELSRAGRE